MLFTVSSYRLGTFGTVCHVCATFVPPQNPYGSRAKSWLCQKCRVPLTLLLLFFLLVASKKVAQLAQPARIVGIPTFSLCQNVAQPWHSVAHVPKTWHRLAQASRRPSAHRPARRRRPLGENRPLSLTECQPSSGRPSAGIKNPAGGNPTGSQSRALAVNPPVGTHRQHVGLHALQRAVVGLPARRLRLPRPSTRTRGWTH